MAGSITIHVPGIQLDPMGFKVYLNDELRDALNRGETRVYSITADTKVTVQYMNNLMSEPFVAEDGHETALEYRMLGNTRRFMPVLLRKYEYFGTDTEEKPIFVLHGANENGLRAYMDYAVIGGEMPSAYGMKDVPDCGVVVFYDDLLGIGYRRPQEGAGALRLIVPGVLDLQDCTVSVPVDEMATADELYRYLLRKVTALKAVKRKAYRQMAEEKDDEPVFDPRMGELVEGLRSSDKHLQDIRQSLERLEQKVSEQAAKTGAEPAAWLGAAPAANSTRVPRPSAPVPPAPTVPASASGVPKAEWLDNGQIRCGECGTVQRSSRIRCFQCGIQLVVDPKD